MGVPKYIFKIRQKCWKQNWKQNFVNLKSDITSTYNVRIFTAAMDRFYEVCGDDCKELAHLETIKNYILLEWKA